MWWITGHICVEQLWTPFHWFSVLQPQLAMFSFHCSYWGPHRSLSLSFAHFFCLFCLFCLSFTSHFCFLLFCFHTHFFCFCLDNDVWVCLTQNFIKIPHKCNVFFFGVKCVAFDSASLFFTAQLQCSSVCHSLLGMKFAIHCKVIHFSPVNLPWRFWALQPILLIFKPHFEQHANVRTHPHTHNRF